MRAMLRRPSAYVPIVLSFAALATVLVRIAWVGTAPAPDEGAAAHIWQILMAAQPPAIFLFAFRWLPVAPREAWRVVALQVFAMVAAMLPVFLLKL